MKKIEFYGGFHNSSPMRVLVEDNKWSDYKNGNSSLYEILSDSQYKRLQNHFCGIKGCTCGGVNRADFNEL